MSESNKGFAHGEDRWLCLIESSGHSAGSKRLLYKSYTSGQLRGKLKALR